MAPNGGAVTVGFRFPVDLGHTGCQYFGRRPHLPASDRSFRPRGLQVRISALLLVNEFIRRRRSPRPVPPTGVDPTRSARHTPNCRCPSRSSRSESAARRGRRASVTEVKGPASGSRSSGCQQCVARLRCAPPPGCTTPPGCAPGGVVSPSVAGRELVGRASFVTRYLSRGPGRIRTAGSRFCRPLPYHLATGPLLRTGQKPCPPRRPCSPRAEACRLDRVSRFRFKI